MKVNVKYEQILEAAIKRLSHFGVHKTTFTEIADDVQLSKQALMYYYHDKASLVKSVGEKIAAEYLQEVQQLVDNGKPLIDFFTELVDMRHRFFGKYHMLFVQLKTEGLGGRSEVEKVRKVSLEAEEKLLVQQIEKAVENGEIAPVDALQTVKLLLETMLALAQVVVHTCPVLSDSDFKTLARKQKQVVRLMINGLRR